LGGFIYAPAYRVQVSTSPTFSSVVWDFDTENLVATPTAADGFSPDPNQVYYWRVCPLDSLGGACLEAAPGTPWLSQAWKARIDPSLMPAATSGSGPELLRPRDLSELGEITPLLEWLPFQGADSYEVQISRFSDFSNILDSEIVNYPAYAPITSFAQRSLGTARLDFGTFYWRVRARSAGVPLGSWSASRRFLIAAHSQWMNARSIGDPSNQLKIAEDAFGEVGVAANYDLTSLHAAQDKDFWYFGFNAYTSATDMKYVLYLDLDHTENSGATSDAEFYTVSTDSAFRPEYAIYIHQKGGGFSASDVVLYKWENNSNWVFVALLSGTGGGLDYDSGSNYVELKVESTGIGMGQDTGSLALALFSVPWGSGTPQDSVPATPGIPGGTVLTHFASVTERLTISLPPDHTTNDPQSFSSVPPFFWEYPEVAPWAGAVMEVYLDQQFTTKIGEYILTSTDPYYADNVHPWPTDLSGDNTYYWRLRPRYLVGIAILGAWSEGKSFVRTGFVPTNLTESVTFATPTFSWDMAEGASSYELQVDNDPAFGSLALNVTTTQNEYTPQNPLPNGTYYWRVRMRRHPNVTNEWSPAEVFNLSYPTPAGLTPHDPLASAVVNRAPTLCWTPLIASQASIPTLAAYKYRVQISFGDPTFSTIYEAVDTEQACYTPSKGYQDGKYYWRVAMIDGNTNLGPFSPTAEFTKQYPMANLIYPTSGDGVVTTPTFQWTVVSGAASYRLEISKNSTFAPLYDSITTNLVEFTPKKFYDINQTYFWRVAIIDADGKYGPFNNETIILDPLGGKNKIFLPLMRRN
jgi:hypothetical protein